MTTTTTEASVSQADRDQQLLDQVRGIPGFRGISRPVVAALEVLLERLRVVERVSKYAEDIGHQSLGRIDQLEGTCADMLNRLPPPEPSERETVRVRIAPPCRICKSGTAEVSQLRDVQARTRIHTIYFCEGCGDVRFTVTNPAT